MKLILPSVIKCAGFGEAPSADYTPYTEERTYPTRPLRPDEKKIGRPVGSKSKIQDPDDVEKELTDKEIKQELKSNVGGWNPDPSMPYISDPDTNTWYVPFPEAPKEQKVKMALELLKEKVPEGEDLLNEFLTRGISPSFAKTVKQIIEKGEGYKEDVLGPGHESYEPLRDELTPLSYVYDLIFNRPIKEQKREEINKPQEPVMADSNANTKKAYKVTTANTQYVTLLQKVAKGVKTVKLADKNLYDVSLDNENNIILAQTVTPKRVKELENDKDIAPVKNDKPHANAADEPKPSEGVSEPSVPVAPNDGRLTNEHTVDKAKDGPEIPAGGGSNPRYDQNEKNKPEKQDQLLGLNNEIKASNEEAVKVAGLMLKANKITVDELPATVNMLSKATPEILEDYRKQASTQPVAKQADDSSKGLQKQATVGAIETTLPVSTQANENGGNPPLKDMVQRLFTLNHRNEQYAQYSKKE